MQPLRRYALRFSNNRNDVWPELSQALPKRHSWLSHAEHHAERAARIGFVFTMLFFASAAIYGLLLSGRNNPNVAAFLDFLDGSAREAGLRIDGLSLTGIKNAPSHTIMSALELPYSGSILSYNTQAARDNLLKLGWVETAEVRRILPSRLEVVITERTPLVRYATDGKIFLIDKDGFILGEDSSSQFSDLLLVSGEGAPLEATALNTALNGRTALFQKIERADLIAERFWVLQLSGDVTIKLPRKVGVLQFDRLESLLAAQKIADMAPKTIDLRLPHRTIVQLRDATAVNREKAIASLMPPATAASTAQAAAPAIARRGKAP